MLPGLILLNPLGKQANHIPLSSLASVAMFFIEDPTATRLTPLINSRTLTRVPMAHTTDNTKV
jgi:hypothetical protein